ncbi:unnamed protein product, partial [Allacma fusca]
KNPEKAPVILWINDLPGFTSLKGVFLETGPFYVDDDNQLRDRNTSWAKTHSMLYIDAPVGTGFSFANSEDAYANNSEEEAEELYEALKQFFTLYNDFQPNDFYLAGESYAGTTIPDFAKKIDDENDKGSFKINLKGLILGSPFLDLSQVHKEDFYYSLGLISAKQRKEFQEAHTKFEDLHKAGKDTEAIQYGLSLHLGPESLTSKMTGFVDTHSALTTVDPPQLGKFVKFIDSKEAHRYLHTGVHKFISANKVVFKHFGSDVFRQHTKTLEGLLNRGHRCLIFVGQFDIYITHDKLEEVVFNLKWDKANEFSEAPRNVWRVNGDVAGYVQSIGSFAYALVRNAGNYAIQDQPEWTTDLLEKFIAGKDF